MTNSVTNLNNTPYRVYYRNVKYPRLEFKTGILHLILPPGANPKKLLIKHHKWIDRKRNFISECLKESSRKKLIERSEDEFNDIVYKLSNFYSKKLRVETSSIYFRVMKTKWGSLSSRGDLTINKLMRYLPLNLIKYVIFHETAHLIEMKHNKKYWEIISKEFKDYMDLERELFTYWFIIAKQYFI